MEIYLSEGWWQVHYPDLPVQLRPVVVALADKLESSFRLADDALDAINDVGFMVVPVGRVQRFLAAVQLVEDCHDCIRLNGFLWFEGDLEPAP